jgi:hypothetical protein
MDTHMQLRSAKFPSMLSNLLHSNQFLKMFSFYSLSLAVITLFGLILAINKGPEVITLSSTGIHIAKAHPSLKAFVEEAVRSYMEKRYKWNPENVVERLKESEAFILPSTQKAFEEAVAKVARFSKEKLASQKIFIDDIEVNLKLRTVLITGTRITSIQNLPAAGEMKLELSFDSGPHTFENPWGVYITKEKED